MQPERICTLFFSPTGTSRKTATAVARGIAAPFAATADSTATDRATATADSSGSTDPANHAAEANRVAATPENGPIPVCALDLTHAASRPETLSADTVAVFAAPVYGGRIPRTALERMEGIRGEGTPAVVIAVYGNRAFEKAAAELADFVRARGFVPVAAAAFVGEHSYSTERTPIAAGRPDGQDLAAAEAFGRAVRRKLAGQGPLPVDAARLKAPGTPLVPLLRFIRFVLAYRRRQKKHPVVLLPAGSADCCTHCGRCAAVCPTGAIARGDELRTDAARCIRCCACVKGCPVGARTFETPFAAALSRNFARRKPPVTLL